MTNTQDKKEERIRLIEYFKEQYRKAMGLRAFLWETLKENKSGFWIGAAFTGIAGGLGAGIPLIGE